MGLTNLDTMLTGVMVSGSELLYKLEMEVAQQFEEHEHLLPGSWCLGVRLLWSGCDDPAQKQWHLLPCSWCLEVHLLWSGCDNPAQKQWECSNMAHQKCQPRCKSDQLADWLAELQEWWAAHRLGHLVAARA